jgi:hypothetical protein
MRLAAVGFQRILAQHLGCRLRRLLSFRPLFCVRCFSRRPLFILSSWYVFLLGGRLGGLRRSFGDSSRLLWLRLAARVIVGVEGDLIGAGQRSYVEGRTEYLLA